MRREPSSSRVSAREASCILELSDKKANDHQVIGYVKDKIRALLDAELAQYNFENEVREENARTLLAEAVDEVEKKQSFFLDIQTNKLETHEEIFDPWSPGNRHHEPSVGAPHEGVDI